MKERNRLHTLWLNTGKERDRVKHARARWAVRKLMRKAKNDWFLHKALEAEKGRHGGKLVWQCIRDIKRGRRGLVPARTAVVKDEEGNVCTTMESQQERVEEKWDILKSALCDRAETVIGYEDRRNQTGLGRVRLLLNLC